MTLKEFEQAYHSFKYSESTVPEHAQPRKKFSDKKANDLTKLVLAYFEFKKVKAWRQSSEGRYIQGRHYTDWQGRKGQEKGMFIPRSKAAVGIGDVSFVISNGPHKGRFGSCEIKIGKDRQRPEQKQFQAEIEASGAIYFIAKDWESFYTNIIKYI